jgi:hypothetical protein
MTVGGREGLSYILSYLYLAKYSILLGKEKIKNIQLPSVDNTSKHQHNLRGHLKIS